MERDGLNSEWKISSYCESNGCAAVKVEPADSTPKGAVGVVERDGMVYITDKDHAARPPVVLTQIEWDAFKLGAKAGEFS